MAIFKYKARSAQGKIKRGQLVGISENDIVSKLNSHELEVLNIKDITNTFEGKLNFLINRIKVKDLVIFSRQFSVMIKSNVPIVESLTILIDQTKNITFQNMLAEIAYEVDSGDFLSDAFARRPKVFSNFFVNIIRSGETSGKLDEVLTYLADEMEHNYDTISKIKGAMTYPIFVLVALVGVGVMLMVYVIPNLTSILKETNAELPLSTKIVIATSDFIKHYLWLIVITIIGLWFLIKAYIKTYSGRRMLDLFKIKLPIFGRLFKYIYLMRFTRSLSTLLKGGVTITRSLEIVADVVNNEVYKEIILETLESINDGNSVSTVMDKSKYVPKMVPQMMAVGEKTGKLTLVLDNITDFYNREAGSMLDNLSKLMEPIIMVFMGVGVGVMVAAVLLPMYNLAGQF